MIAANEIAENLEKQGYEVVKIDVPAKRLRDVFIDESENVVGLDKLMTDKLSESVLYNTSSQSLASEPRTQSR